MMSKKILFILLAIICFNNKSIAQQKASPLKNDNNLFSAGFASGFIGGLYDNWYPYKELEKHGNFGIGAPGHLDGELLLLNGKIYQTQSTGKTTLVADTGKLPYVVVCFFKAKKAYKHVGALSKTALYSYLDSLLSNQNGIYAIHITGKFKSIKTRAFPPVEKPYLPLASMLNRQQFFEHSDIPGDLVGFRIPTFMEGAHISGYHFHFLSEDKTAGGHLIDLNMENITIEIDTLTNYTMDLPQTTDFNNFDFKKDRKEEIKSVENGKKL
jgi:acetolactate decarboxylase